MAGKANGCLLQQLLESSGYCDTACSEMLRNGAHMLGVLENSGIGTPLQPVDEKSVDGLRESIESWNNALMKELREDDLAEQLMQITEDDAKLGRMTSPVPIVTHSVRKCLLCPRFGVQQLKPDGRIKVRAVDNFSWAAVAGASKAERKDRSVNGVCIV